MRATWPGARSGRIKMVTGPLEVSRSNVLSRSASGFWVMGNFGLLFLAGFDDGNHKRAPGNGVAEPLTDRQRRATLEHVYGGVMVGGLHLLRRLMGGVGEARLGQKLAIALEGELECDLHAGPRLLVRRQLQALGQQRPDLIEPVSRMVAVKRLGASHMPLHFQHRNLIERIKDFRDAARLTENPTEIRRKRLPAKHATETRRWGQKKHTTETLRRRELMMTKSAVKTRRERMMAKCAADT